MKYFIDTSALVKIYHDESGSVKVLEFYRGENDLLISDLCKIEFLSTISRKYREHEINIDILHALINKFQYDTANRYKVLKFSSLVIEEAWNLLRRFSENQHLRTLDSIQFAFLNIYCESETIFVSADKRLSRLVESEGFPTLIP